MEIIRMTVDEYNLQFSNISMLKVEKIILFISCSVEAPRFPDRFEARPVKLRLR